MEKFLIIDYTITMDETQDGHRTYEFSKASHTREEILSELESSNYATIPFLKETYNSSWYVDDTQITSTSTAFLGPLCLNKFRYQDGGQPEPIECQFGFEHPEFGTLSINNEGTIVTPDGTPINDIINKQDGGGEVL